MKLFHLKKTDRCSSHTYTCLEWKLFQLPLPLFLHKMYLELDSIEFSGLTFEFASLKNQVITFMSFILLFYFIFCSHLWLEYENHDDHRFYTTNLPLQAESTSKSHHITRYLNFKHLAKILLTFFVPKPLVSHCNYIFMLASWLFKSEVILLNTVDSQMVRQLFTDDIFDGRRALAWTVIRNK